MIIFNVINGLRISGMIACEWFCSQKRLLKQELYSSKIYNTDDVFSHGGRSTLCAQKLVNEIFFVTGKVGNVGKCVGWCGEVGIS